MREDFAIFVLSHGRAKTIATVNAFLKAGYTGKYFIILDDMDDQISEYKKRFGDHCVVFPKKEVAKSTDTMDNFGKLSIPLYARNWSFDFAKEQGLKYFLQCDDDIKDFTGKYVDGSGRFKTVKITNFDRVTEALIEFIETDDRIAVTAFSNAGGFFGGKNGRYKDGLGRTINQAMLFRTDCGCRFVGTQNEDLNISLRHFDKLTFECYSVVVTSPQRGTNAGGIAYDSMYESNFYSVIMSPSCIKITDGGKMKRLSANMFPKIISDRWRKNA